MKKSKRFEKDNLKRGIYILPNLFTSLNLFCGFYAVVAAINGDYVNSAKAILIAVVFDGLDGKVARATKTTSKFGVEYDSLADLISFGLAPGLMMYLWVLKPFGRIGWLAGFLFMACGALRLARFNTQTGTTSSDYFVGLPIPAGAWINAVTVLFCHRMSFEGKISPVLILVMIYMLSFLMVSTIKFNSFKKLELFRKMNFNYLVGAVLVLILIAMEPSIVLFLLGLGYVFSGPLSMIRHYKEKRYKDTEIREIEKHRTIP